MDTGCSYVTSGFEADFGGTLETLSSPLQLDGIGGSLFATKRGRFRYEVINDDGKIEILEGTGYYMPELKCRLFSPQVWAQELEETGKGTSSFSVNHKHGILSLPSGSTLTIPYHLATRLPVVPAFKSALGSATSITLASCVSNESNQNLTTLQKGLLRWHFRFGHVGFSTVQWIGRQGWVGQAGEQWGKTTVKIPKCAACQFGKQERNTTGGSHETKENEGTLKADKLEPGDLVFSDQYESRLPGRAFGHRGSKITSRKYCGGTLFCDAASGWMYIQHQASLNAIDTITSKLSFEREALGSGVHVKSYRTDNGIYKSKDFADALDAKKQTIDFSGVGGHHHNGVAENGIKTVVRSARTMMIHAALRWPDCAEKDLWPMALAHAVHLHNHMPNIHSGLSPIEIWTKTTSSHSTLRNAHPWGCPVYVLDPTLQDGKKIPKWQPRSRRGQYLGASPLHASSVGLVRNLKTGNISPQFHVVYDDFFETVHATDNEEPNEWPELIVFQSFRADLDEDGYVPELSDEWLDDSALRERREREQLYRGDHPSSIGNRNNPPSGPTEASVLRERPPSPMERELLQEQRQATPPTPMERELPQLRRQGEPRRSGRERRKTTHFTFDKQHGYMVVKALVARTIKSLMVCSSTTHDMRYIHALLLEPEYGMAEGLLGHAIAQNPHLLKAAQNDPDTPNFHQAMGGPYREEFIKAMQKEIEELEEHNTWTVISKNETPEGANILAGTWAFKIKRFPDGRLRKFKARFCARGDQQVEGIDYFEKYAPVVAWTTVRMMLCMSLHLGWATRQVDFSNAFVQATLKEEVYMQLPKGFEKGGQNDGVLKLNRSLYGLVQAPMYWYEHLKKALEDNGFKVSSYDPCMFFGKGMVVLCYVDDCLFFGPDLRKIDGFIEELEQQGFALTKEQDVYAFLGIQMVRDRATGKYTLTQEGLIKKVLRIVGMENCNSKKTPAGVTPLGTDAEGAPFSEDWQYASVVGMLLISHPTQDLTFSLQYTNVHDSHTTQGTAMLRELREFVGI
jgi:Reverse transcriptase (RNA-dependent DNA polymerase)